MAAATGPSSKCVVSPSWLQTVRTKSPFLQNSKNDSGFSQIVYPEKA